MITKDTTDEQILAGVARTRQVLATKATQDLPAETLAGYVNDIAAEEGRAYVRALIRDALVAGEDGEQFRKRLLGVMAQGPSDSWSGRANDARRSRFDGICAEAAELLAGGLAAYGW